MSSACDAVKKRKRVGAGEEEAKSVEENVMKIDREREDKQIQN